MEGKTLPKSGLVDGTVVSIRLEKLEDEIEAVKLDLLRSEEYLRQAAYAQSSDDPRIRGICPQCHNPMGNFAEGDHPCLAIHRLEEVETRRTLTVLETEQLDLLAVLEETEAGVEHASVSLPVGALKEIRSTKDETFACAVRVWERGIAGTNEQEQVGGLQRRNSET